jgi:hypothetical protein
MHDPAQSCRERSVGRDPWFDNPFYMGMFVSQSQSSIICPASLTGILKEDADF